VEVWSVPGGEIMRKIHLTLVKDQYPNTIPVYADFDYKRPKYKSKKYKDWSLDMNKDKMFYYDFFYKKGENSILEDANNGIDPLKVSVKNFDKFISLLKSLKFPFTIKEEKIDNIPYIRLLHLPYN
jgi:hypothetical protein